MPATPSGTSLLMTRKACHLTTDESALAAIARRGTRQCSHVPAVQASIPQLQTGLLTMHASPGLM